MNVHNPDAVFGPDRGPDFRSIAEQIRALTTSTIKPSEYSDVLTLLDYMREQTVTLYDKTQERIEVADKRDAELAQRERDLAARERDLEVRIRALNSALKVKETAGARLRRYLGK